MKTYGFIFEAINNVLLAMLMGLKKFFSSSAMAFVVIIGVVILAYFASGQKILKQLLQLDFAHSL